MRQTTKIAAYTAAFTALLAVPAFAAFSDPSIEQYAVPATLHHLSATVAPVQSNQDILKKIGPGFAEGYGVSTGTIDFDAPDHLVFHAHSGIMSGTAIYTNTTRTFQLGIFHHSDDISGDVTKRNTIFSLGVLPQNYLDTMRQQYVDAETLDGVNCDVFFLRYNKDRVNDNRRFEVWVSKDQHYVVQKRVWDGGNHEHETIKYKNPIEVMPGFWVPTRAEAYDSQGELGGIVSQEKISAR